MGDPKERIFFHILYVGARVMVAWARYAGCGLGIFFLSKRGIVRMRTYDGVCNSILLCSFMSLYV